MTIKQYLDLNGLSLYDKNIKNYMHDLKDVQAFKSLIEFPGEGKWGVIYLAMDTRNLYAWSSYGYIRVGLNEETVEKINVAYESAQIAYEHAMTKDGSNPHKTTYSNIVNIPNLATEDDINNLINLTYD